MRRGYVDTRHGQVHYREAGSGPPLVILHASPRSSRAFAGLMPLLATSHHVVAPDTLGFGESDPLPRGATIEMLADCMADLIVNLDLAPSAVFGLHTGNKIGAALAARAPDIVTRLIVCGMTHSLIADHAERERAIRALLSRNPIDPEDVSDVAEKVDRLQGQDGFDRIYDANYAFDLADTLSRVGSPSLVLELAVPSEAHFGLQAGTLAAAMPDGHAATIERSDRDLLEREPQRLADAILDFLDV